MPTTVSCELKARERMWHAVLIAACWQAYNLVGIGQGTDN